MANTEVNSIRKPQQSPATVGPDLSGERRGRYEDPDERDSPNKRMRLASQSPNQHQQQGIGAPGQQQQGVGAVGTIGGLGGVGVGGPPGPPGVVAVGNGMAVLPHNPHTAHMNNRTDKTFIMHLDNDERHLSQYQILGRMQIEIFESNPDDAGTNAQGRNRPINPGQVGIRCIHCKHLPKKQRKTGSVYYPTRLDGVYQTAQKMIVGHFCKHCTAISEELRRKLIFLKDQKSKEKKSQDGGGKRYWADGVRALGVIETPKDGLAFATMPTNPMSPSNTMPGSPMPGNPMPNTTLPGNALSGSSLQAI